MQKAEGLLCLQDETDDTAAIEMPVSDVEMASLHVAFRDTNFWAVHAAAGATRGIPPELKTLGVTSRSVVLAELDHISPLHRYYTFRAALKVLRYPERPECVEYMRDKRMHAVVEFMRHRHSPGDIDTLPEPLALLKVAMALQDLPCDSKFFSHLVGSKHPKIKAFVDKVFDLEYAFTRLPTVSAFMRAMIAAIVARDEDEFRRLYVTLGFRIGRNSVN